MKKSIIVTTCRKKLNLHEYVKTLTPKATHFIWVECILNKILIGTALFRVKSCPTFIQTRVVSITDENTSRPSLTCFVHLDHTSIKSFIHIYNKILCSFHKDAQLPELQPPDSIITSFFVI